jgi:hypothetical protein
MGHGGFVETVKAVLVKQLWRFRRIKTAEIPHPCFAVLCSTACGNAAAWIAGLGNVRCRSCIDAAGLAQQGQ